MTVRGGARTKIHLPCCEEWAQGLLLWSDRGFRSTKYTCSPRVQWNTGYGILAMECTSENCVSLAFGRSARVLGENERLGETLE